MRYDLSTPHGRLKWAREQHAEFGSLKVKQFTVDNKIAQSTYSLHENGRRGIDKPTAEKYGLLLGVEPMWLLSGDERLAPPGLPRNGDENLPAVRPEKPVVTPVRSADGAEKAATMPVYTATPLGDGFLSIQAAPIDWIALPPPLAATPGAYAFDVPDEAHDPALMDGDRILMRPGQQPRVGDDAIISMQDGRILLGRITIKTPAELVVRQYGADREISVPRLDISQVATVAVIYRAR